MGPVAPATGQDAPVRLDVLLGMQMYRPPPFTPFMLLLFSFLACTFLCVCLLPRFLHSCSRGGEGKKMSSIAKRMLERHGWKEGMGLGKNAQGVSTYVKVVRRDPHTTTGLGHAADATQAPQASTFSVELDAVYADMSRTGKKKEKRQTGAAVSIDVEAEVKNPKDVKREKRGRQHSTGSCNSGRISDGNDGRCDRGDSSSDDGSSSDDEIHVDITRLKDHELLRRCGGVRLGRAGRHRFFDGKLRRIENSQREERRDGI
ncbi:hypothetical protein TCSYLVIO_009028 [Trypanosoma cruzi]|nr:hypothetical protein TCSYLVIO_009028 [Trypanosoma cruzi]